MVVIKFAPRLTFLYILFAGLSTFVNIGSQIISMLAYSGIYAVAISIFVGTITALPLRYMLDKHFIFSFQSNSLKHDGHLFLLYSLMGIFTTTIFWLTEYVFHLIFMTSFMRYIGGILGLSIGYFIKYWLDKRFVFINKNRMFSA